MISFAVQAVPDAADWLSVARRAEALGFAALGAPDHPGSTLSPFVTLGAAAAVTSSIALGTAVVNAGVRGPLEIAADAASLDLLSGGRALLGLGAGHTPAEWAAIGADYPSPSERIVRLEAVVTAVRQLLDGATVDMDGPGFSLSAARLEFAPQRHIPLLVGGNSPSLVRAGAALADIVEVGGLGRTLADGHFHEIRWRPGQVDRVVDELRQAAGSRRPTLGALVQLVAITDEPERVARRFLDAASSRQPAETLPSVDEVLGAPFVLIGSVSEIATKLDALRNRWGFARYTIRAPHMDDVAEVMTFLGTTAATSYESSSGP
jgi:probable F420-dependent oxidoreductase